MKNNPLTVHMVVKNEDQYIWYSLSSILPYADYVLITDTGSTDNTIKIIESFKSSKIELEKLNIKDVTKLAEVRQKQIDKIKTEWFWIVDGDEIYTDSLCLEIKQIISEEEEIEGIVVGRYDLLGDIHHFQSENVGTYHLFGKKGHHVVRLLNKRNVPGIHVSGTYPYEGYYDKNEREIIHHSPQVYRFTKGRLWHAMYLKRSSLGSTLQTVFHRNKYKIELGKKIEESIPTVFMKRPDNIRINTILERPLSYEVKASLITPFKMLKRIFFS